jgi:hypothetical protein
LPQFPQKLLLAATVAPQLLHFSSEPGRDTPHDPQKRAPDLFFVLHFGHSTWKKGTMVIPPKTITA